MTEPNTQHPRRGVASAWLSALRYAREATGPHFGLAFNAAAMALATFANGMLGFVYWWIAARYFTPSAVGFASAAISLIALLSIAAELGLGTLLLGEIPRQRRLSPHLISAALMASIASAAALGAAYLAFTTMLGSNFGLSGGVPSTRLLVFFGICTQTASVVLDAALIGVLKAPLRLFRNLLFAFSKLLFVVVVAAFAVREDWQLNAIIASWVVGQGAASLALAGVLKFGGARVWYRPRFDLLKSLFGTAIWYYALDVVASAPTLLLPVIIAVVLSPEQNAPFYLAWVLLSLASVVPTALATVLFTVGSGASAGAASSVRFSLVVSLGIGVVAALGFWLLSGVFLHMLNPVYSDLVGSDLRFLGASVPLAAVKLHYMTVERLDGRARPATYALAALGSVEILFAGLGAAFHGLLGATVGWLIAMAIEAACLWPAINRHLGGEVFGLKAAACRVWKRMRPGSTAPIIDEHAPAPTSGLGQSITKNDRHDLLMPQSSAPDRHRGGLME